MFRNSKGRISSDGHGKKLEVTKEMLVEETKEFRLEKEGALGVKKTFSSDQDVDPRVIEANNQFSNTQIIGILSINADGDILYSNSKAQEIFDCPNLTGSSIHEFVPDHYFGSSRFKKLHVKLIRTFFGKPFVGGRMLDPGTILRAKLKSGRLVPLNIGLEAKLDPITAHPTVVVGYVTEAAAIIDTAKVEKMLARATLVVIQQFISQTVVGVFSAIETAYIPLLRYGDTTYDPEKLHKCLDYSFYKLSTEDKGGEDFKMLLFIVSTALTIAISVLPLFVNHMNDHDKDEDLTEKQKKEFFRTLGLFMNDFQERLSEWRTFRSYDIISLTVIVAISNLFLLYVLRTIPDEYGMKSLKECEETKVFEEKITLAMTWLGVIPACYLFCKEIFWCLKDWVKNGYTFKVKPEGSESGTPRPPPVRSLSKRKGFESSMNLATAGNELILLKKGVDSFKASKSNSFSNLPSSSIGSSNRNGSRGSDGTGSTMECSIDGGSIDGATFDPIAFNKSNSIQLDDHDDDKNVIEPTSNPPKFNVMKGARGSVRMTSVSSTQSEEMNLPPV